MRFAQSTMPNSVAKIENQAKRKPAKESNPSHFWLIGHQRAARDNGKNGNEWDQGRSERSRALGVSSPQDHDPNRDEDEGKECADVTEIDDFIDIGHGCKPANENSSQNGADVWSPEFWMNG